MAAVNKLLKMPLAANQTRKAQLMQRGTRNSGAYLKAQSPEGARRPAANYL